MKKILSIILAASLCLSILAAFSGCGCEHPQSKLKLESTTATCTQAGVETYECSSCGEKGVVTKEVKAYGHNYVQRVEDHHNLKCEHCDLLHYNLTINKAPETIKVNYKKTSSAAASLLAEFTVDNVDWELDNNSIDDDFSIYLTVTLKTFNDKGQAPQSQAVILAVKVSDSEGEETIFKSNKLEFYSSDVNKSKVVRCYKSNNSRDNHTQYSFNVDVYDTVTCGNDNNGNYKLLSPSK